jgi:hypothetical protein
MMYDEWGSNFGEPAARCHRAVLPCRLWQAGAKEGVSRFFEPQRGEMK